MIPSNWGDASRVQRIAKLEKMPKKGSRTRSHRMRSRIDRKAKSKRILKNVAHIRKRRSGIGQWNARSPNVPEKF
jgi:hypothetical protein